MSAKWEAVWSVADGWERATLVALIVATFAQTLFIIIYGSRPWWRARVGRALFLKSASLCVILWLSLINAFLVYTGQEPVAAVAMWMVALAIIYQLVALLLSPRRPEIQEG